MPLSHQDRPKSLLSLIARTPAPETSPQPLHCTWDDERQIQRDRLLIDLLFASKDLATSQLRYATASVVIGRLQCAECHTPQHAGAVGHSHSRFCRTGRVLGILSALESLYANYDMAASVGLVGSSADCEPYLYPQASGPVVPIGAARTANVSLGGDHADAK